MVEPRRTSDRVARAAGYAEPLDGAARVWDAEPATEPVAGDALLELLLAQVYPWARGVAFLLCRDHHDAQDLVQDAFVQAYRKPPQPLSVEVLRAWLRTVIFRLYLRRRRRALREAMALTRLRRDARADWTPSETTEATLDALDTLSPRQRACVVLRYLEDQSEEQVAALLGIRLGTVKAHLAQARARLRERMEPGSRP